MMSELGTLTIHTEFVEIRPGQEYRQITGADWEGPPITVIDQWALEWLPEWAIAHEGELIQIGSYVLRRTGLFSFSRCGYYYQLVDEGEVYWLWWRICQVAELVWGRALLTLAVWGLAKWPEYGCRPTWGDVVARWRK